MRITYLVSAAIGFLVSIFLSEVGSIYYWMAIGFGWIMLIFGIFCSSYKEPLEEFKDNGIFDNLNDINKEDKKDAK